MPPEKTMTDLKGLLRVWNNIGPECTLLDLTTNNTQEVHVKRLRNFDYDPDPVNSMDVANAGKQLFFVDQILKHKGDPKEKTSFFSDQMERLSVIW